MTAWIQALLLLAGDIETNPGPPKNRGGPPGGVYIETRLEAPYRVLLPSLSICSW